MTSTITRKDGILIKITVSCDQIDCGVALNDTQITDGGGLRKMGWQALPMDQTMRHYCPEHKRAPITSGKEQQ